MVVRGATRAPSPAVRRVTSGPRDGPGAAVVRSRQRRGWTEISATPRSQMRNRSLVGDCSPRQGVHHSGDRPRCSDREVVERASSRRRPPRAPWQPRSTAHTAPKIGCARHPACGRTGQHGRSTPWAPATPTAMSRPRSARCR